MSAQTPEQAARAAELCHCGHLRAVHDPCSVCHCPFFRPADRVKAKAYAERPIPTPEEAAVWDLPAAARQAKPRRKRKAKVS
jgi:hypothetical protein